MKFFGRRWVVSIVFIILLFIGVSMIYAQEDSYTVKSGDTIQSIANRFSISADALLQYNGIIDPNRIFRGQVLRIPIGVVTPPQTHTVKAGETLQWIAERYNLTQQELIEANNITNLSRLTVGSVLNIPAHIPSVFTTEHIVQPGQTLREIGELYGIGWEELASVNNLPNPNYIQVGQTLIVPAYSPAPETPAPAPAQPAPAQPQQPQTQLRTYVVQPGDSPVLIADRFGVTLDSLIELNNLGGNLAIFAGDVLLIPPTGGAGGGVSTAVATSFTPPGRYIVQPGDTLFAIATRYGRNVYDIAAANGLLNLNAIYIGQSLTIN